MSIGVSAPFRNEYPQLVEFFAKVDIPIDTLNKALAQMSEKRESPKDAALKFMRDHPATWKAWLPSEVAERVEAGL
ncbi:Substrate binding domain of ABC-type glycine betaine transport system [compost metagenome]